MYCKNKQSGGKEVFPGRKCTLLQKIMKECKYPNCIECEFDDCHMEERDIALLIKIKHYQSYLEIGRQKQKEYRSKVRNALPHCDRCEYCLSVKKEKLDGLRRLCIAEMRLIEQKVSASPQWCRKRNPSNEYIKRRERQLAKKREKYQKEREEMHVRK